jgi:hypothetical protein
MDMLRLMAMGLLQFVAVVGVLLSVAGCGGSDTTNVTGVLRMTGGPSGATQPGVAGKVFFEGHGKRTTAMASSDGSFSLSLPPGEYQVTGTSPQFGSGEGICRTDSPVKVGESRIQGLVVACSRK